MRLLFRVDASAQIGAGHFIRCFALAQECRHQGHDVTFLLGEGLSPVFKDYLKRESINCCAVEYESGSLQDASATARQAWRLGSHWVILDGYCFGNPKYQTHLKLAGLRILMLDDFAHAPRYFTDLILNQNTVNFKLYRSKAPHSHLLMGPRFALLRREFLSRPVRSKSAAKAPINLLLLMGGSDPHNFSAQVLLLLSQLAPETLRVKTVIGPQNPHYSLLKRKFRDCPFKLEFVRQPRSIRELMNWADIAISAAGSTCWELAFMGVPSLVILTAENQRESAKTLSSVFEFIRPGLKNRINRQGFERALLLLLKNSRKRRQMIKSAQLLVDGKGCFRVVEELCRRSIHLRPVRFADSRQIWRWANRAETRAVSFSQDPIPWKVHQSWFNKKFKHQRSLFFMAEYQGRPAGQIRYDVSGTEAVVSLMLDPVYRGRGFGVDLIRLSAFEVFKTKSVRAIRAYVLRGNQASLNLFKRSGFEVCFKGMFRGRKTVQLILKK